MEELQSTDILSREILEDARKKASNILKTADETVKIHKAEWDKKTTESITELEKKFNNQRKIITGKIMAKLPIDKKRIKVQTVEKFLFSAIEVWYQSLNRDQVLSLLTGELVKRVKLNHEIIESSVSTERYVYYFGIERKDIESIINKLNSLISVFSSFSIKEVPAIQQYPSITLETENVRIIVSIQNIVDFLLQDKRTELIEALTGSSFLESNFL
jgi:vacuolar-type H+-ATPase subunit E/Vma4